jgi:hypothetical protein
VHSGDTARQVAHAAAICLFLHHARARGYATDACRTDPAFGPAEPDAVIARGAEWIYVLSVTYIFAEVARSVRLLAILSKHGDVSLV